MVGRGDEPVVRTYGGWRIPRSAGVFGLGTLGSALLLAGAVAVLIGLMVDLAVGASVLAVVVFVVGPLLIRVGERTGLQVIATRVAWWWGRAQRSHLFLSGPLAGGGARAWLPGVLAPTTLRETTDAWGRPVGLVEVPWTRSRTAVLRCTPDGAGLVDPGQIDQWVAGWGAWLAALAHEPGVIAAAVTVDTAPDPGDRLRTELAHLTTPTAPPLARDVFAEIAGTYPRTGAVIDTRVSITWGPSRTTRRAGDGDDAAVEIGHRLPGLAESLARAGAGVAVPLSGAEIAAVVRTAYDPATPLHPGAGTAGGGFTWERVGPVAAVESWSRMRHDSGVSVTWGLDAAPRGTVLSGVLGRLLGPHPAITRKRVTLLMRPHPPGDAARIVDRDVRTTRFSATTSERAATARAHAAVRAAEQSAAEEAAGAGLVRFTAVVTATVQEHRDLPAAVAAVDTLAGTARLSLRRMYGSQSAGFAAGLGVGIVLARHASLPDEVLR